VWQTDDQIKEDLGDKDIQIAAIGQAGENLVRYACVISNRTRAAGKCGMGAVMGSKNLKAVVVRGTGSIGVADPDGFMTAVEDAWDKIKNSGTYKNLTSRGTLGVFSAEKAEESGSPTYSIVRNLQDEYVDPEWLRKIGAEAYFSKHVKRSMACFACPFHCSQFVRIEQGQYAGLACEKLEANSIANFGFNLGVDYPPAIIKAHALTSMYGLDMDSASCAIAWAMECYQRRIITKEDTDGLELKWGDHETVIRLIQKIAFRDGFGNVLAEDVKRASTLIGRDSYKYAMEIKGMGNREFMRNAKAYALGVAVALRGGGHTTGSPLTELHQEMPPELCEKVYGVSKSAATDRLSYSDKAKLVIHTQRLHAVLDSLGICMFAGTWFGPELLGPDDLAGLVSRATGCKMTGKEIMIVGERILNVGKAFNTLHAGFERKDDYPPARMMQEQISGPYQGERLEKRRFDNLLDEYYSLHGWDVKTGWQTRESLEDLGLAELADDLQKAGLLELT
jgi:aldehyde:ferredoxin oxidoreductase